MLATHHEGTGSLTPQADSVPSHDPFSSNDRCLLAEVPHADSLRILLCLLLYVPRVFPLLLSFLYQREN